MEPNASRPQGRPLTTPIPPLDLESLRAAAREGPPREDLEAWIHAREASVAGLKPGAAAGILWNDPELRDQTEFSLVYLPGYTATRGELSPVPERLARALGANLFFARLSGHGTLPDGHRDVTLTDWLRDGVQALEAGARLGRRVIVMATSTGGTLASWLVLGPWKAAPAATILVSPNLATQNRMTEALLWPFNEAILRLVVGDQISVPAANALNEASWDLTHHSHSLIPMMQLVALARRGRYSQWPTPVLVVYDPNDDVVRPRVTEKYLTRVAAERAELVQWTSVPGESRHVLAGDALSPRGNGPLTELCLGFLHRKLGTGL